MSQELRLHYGVSTVHILW